MNEFCPECGQRTDIEVGFYYGAAYVSYALTVAISVASFIAWYIFVGISSDDNRIFGWLIFNGLLLLILQPWLMRIARTIWLSFFVKYNPRWKEEPPAVAAKLLVEQLGAAVTVNS